MVEYHLGTAREDKLRFWCLFGFSADQWKQRKPRVPESPIGKYLSVIPSKNNGVEFRVIAVPALLKEQSVSFAKLSPAGSTTIYH